MTWSITPPVLRGGKPVLRWDGKPLRALSDEEFTTAITAANALGDDVVTEASKNGPGNPMARMAGEASSIIAAIVIEMTRRGWNDSDGNPETKPT